MVNETHNLLRVQGSPVFPYEMVDDGCSIEHEEGGGGGNIHPRGALANSIWCR
jgi:hypothetical protein